MERSEQLSFSGFSGNVSSIVDEYLSGGMEKIQCAHLFWKSTASYHSLGVTTMFYQYLSEIF